MTEDRPGVLAGRRLIPYERLGAGAPVLALTAQRRAARTWTEALATAFRVVLVAPPSPDESWPELADVVDAFGLERPALVADGALADAVLEMVLRDPWRVRSVALLFPVPPGRPPGIPLRADLEPIALPILLLPVPGEATARGGLRPLMEFLGGASGGLPSPR